MPEAPVAARAALHPWEEPPISGKNGSGAVFFSGCSLGCIFCQNEEISHGNFGKVISEEALWEIMENLIAQGAHNINLVNPTHFAHVVRNLPEFPVPLVWNSGGYDRVETLRTLEGKISVYLPDLKYMEQGPAAKYSSAPDYPEAARAAIREMVRQTGPCVLDENGLLVRGTVIRHLLLPGQLEGARQVMDWISREFAPGTVLFSLMSQYTPWGQADRFPELNRTLRRGEIRAAQAYMENLGLEGFVQDPDSARRGFTPDFDLTGI
jgi:putative pyruvate formate lyase activating enzyme